MQVGGLDDEGVALPGSPKDAHARQGRDEGLKSGDAHRRQLATTIPSSPISLTL